MIYANLTIKTWRCPVRADFRCAGVRAVHTPTRREFIYSPRASLGSVAFTSLFAAEAKKNPLVPQDGHLPAKAADDICFFRGCTVDSVPPSTALYQMNCENRFSGDRGIGACVNYELGTLNQDLPGFIVLPEVSYPQGGAAHWSNGCLLAKLNNTHAAQHPGHDDNKLTFCHAGRFKRLSRFGSTVIKELIG
jgi:hypothetical protein